VQCYGDIIKIDKSVTEEMNSKASKNVAKIEKQECIT
jgi:hypothetical protein